MSGKIDRTVKGNPLAALRGADVEVRTVGGAIVRGELVSSSSEWLQVERHTGRVAFVRSATVSSITDERPPGLAPAVRRAAEERLDRDET